MGCEECKAQNRFAYESAMSMAERTIKRLWIVVIMLVLLFAGSNLAWIIYESQFETVETTDTDIQATQFGTGTNIVGGGDISYGAESKDQNSDH